MEVDHVEVEIMDGSAYFQRPESRIVEDFEYPSQEINVENPDYHDNTPDDDDTEVKARNVIVSGIPEASKSVMSEFKADKDHLESSLPASTENPEDVASSESSAIYSDDVSSERQASKDFLWNWKTPGNLNFKLNRYGKTCSYLKPYLKSP
ncbi:unnamed protein product [Caenorhabditis nigoni]